MIHETNLVYERQLVAIIYVREAPSRGVQVVMGCGVEGTVWAELEGIV